MIRSDLIVESGPHPRRLRFTVDDYYKMIEMGMIEDYERSEIIDGEMVPKMTIGDRHALTVDLLNRILVKTLPESYRVRVQNPLRIGIFDEPEPDFVIADLAMYDGKRHPTPAETILVIEVSDASLKQDRDTKLPMYAEAGIAEAWIVNLRDNVIEVHQNPALNIYQQVKIFRSGEKLESSVLPQLGFDVDMVIG
ncbi:MAG: Uma2 family endonuclease [Acidobacteria bacterium]|nr:Uma2 family endonuclease [Acidobacteriota bacterium]